jgi:hypothetical protein
MMGWSGRAPAPAYKPDTDKRVRVIAQTDLFAGGSVRFPRRAA